MAKDNVVRAYKDTVFVDLFSEDTHAKENFLSLYNALFDENLTDTSALENIRLEQVLRETGDSKNVKTVGLSFKRYRKNNRVYQKGNRLSINSAFDWLKTTKGT